MYIPIRSVEESQDLIVCKFSVVPSVGFVKRYPYSVQCRGCERRPCTSCYSLRIPLQTVVYHEVQMCCPHNTFNINLFSTYFEIRICFSSNKVPVTKRPRWRLVLGHNEGGVCGQGAGFGSQHTACYCLLM